MLFLLIGMLITVNKIEYNIKQHQVQNVGKTKKKEDKKIKFELLLAHIVHVMVIISIILLIYYFVRS